MLKCVVKIGLCFFLSSFLSGDSDQITDEKVFYKAEVLCEYKIIYYMSCKYLLICPLLLLGILFLGFLMGLKRRKRVLVIPVKICILAERQLIQYLC